MPTAVWRIIRKELFFKQLLEKHICRYRLKGNGGLFLAFPSVVKRGERLVEYLPRITKGDVSTGSNTFYEG